MVSPKSSLLAAAFASLVYADTCDLTAAHTGYSSVNLGSTSASGSFSGFFLKINGGEKIDLTPDTGNAFPPNYVCGHEDPDYAMAVFSDTPKGRIGMCIENSKMVPGQQFDCADQGGKFFEGTTDGEFYGLGSSVGSFCTITFDC